MEKYFYEVFESAPRQGPGSTETTRKAFSYLSLLPPHPEILDVGCGNGNQSIDLAQLSNGHITAVDINTNLLEALQDKIQKYGLQSRVKTIEADMSALPFNSKIFDLIWAEGSIYNIGVEIGLNKWKEFLKSGGYIVFTEACYFKDDTPEELRKFWNSEYPDITTVDKNVKIGINCGLQLIKHFPLPHFAWKLEFYDHIERKTYELKEKYEGIKEAQECLDSILHEINIFDKYNEYFGYEFFVFRKS